MDVLSERRPQHAGVVGRLLDWRTRYGFGWIESIVLFAYCAILTCTIPFHEPWADEAQAWLIARDSSAWDIVRHRLHYEGTPPLWHLTLHLFHLFGGTYTGMNWLGGAFAAAGVVVLLRWSPFPLVLRALLPFTFFLQYQYAVVARGYTMFALLVFSLCALFPSRRWPLAFACVAGLLANLSMQGVFISALAMCLYAWEALGRGKRRRQWRHLRWMVLTYLGFLLCAGLVAVPAPDVNFVAAGNRVATGPVHDFLVHWVGQPTARLPWMPQPVTPELPRRKVDFIQSPGEWAVWYFTCDERDSACYHDPFHTKPALQDLINGANQTTWPISTSKTLACIFLIALVFWLRAVGGMRFLLFGASLLLLGQVLWSVDHHAGMFFISLLAAIWLARASEPAMQTRLDRPFLLVLLIVVVLQIGWTVHCVGADIQGSYDPGRDAAAYLKRHPARRIAAFQYFTCSMQPYFQRNPFFNLRSSYWLWSSIDNPDAHYHETIVSHPDVVVFSMDFVRPGIMENEWAPMLLQLSPEEERTLTRNPIVRDLRANGYRETHRICGSRFMRLGTSMGVCDIFFVPTPQNTGAL